MYYTNRMMKRIAALAVFAVAGIVVNCACGAAERDPFASPLSEREEAVLVKTNIDETLDLRVTGIVCRDKKDLAAIVNGRVVRVNDIVGGKQIIEIDLNGGKVILSDASKRRHVLYLKQGGKE